MGIGRPTLRLRLMVGLIGAIWMLYGASILWGKKDLVTWRQNLAMRRLNYSGCMCPDCVSGILHTPSTFLAGQVEVPLLGFGDPATVGPNMLASGFAVLIGASIGVPFVRRVLSSPPAPANICIRCGYDLAGLTAISRCPECGVRRWPS